MFLALAYFSKITYFMGCQTLILVTNNIHVGVYGKLKTTLSLSSNMLLDSSSLFYHEKKQDNQLLVVSRIYGEVPKFFNNLNEHLKYCCSHPYIHSQKTNGPVNTHLISRAFWA